MKALGQETLLAEVDHEHGRHELLPQASENLDGKFLKAIFSLCTS